MIEDISVNTHSSIRIKDIYIDPYKITNIQKAKIIFITHPHYDHFSIEDINKIKTDETIFVIPKSMMNIALENNISKEKIVYLNPFDKINIDNIEIDALPSYNTNKNYHPKENNWLGYKIKIDDTNIYVCGDCDDISNFIDISCDTLLVPIGGKFTMDYKEGANFTNKINPKYVIPIHYGDIVGDKSFGIDFMKLINSNINVVLKIS